MILPTVPIVEIMRRGVENLSYFSTMVLKIFQPMICVSLVQQYNMLLVGGKARKIFQSIASSKIVIKF